MERKQKLKAEKKLVPKILRKFDKQRLRKKGLYVKSYEIMFAITEALKETVNDFSATAYFASLTQMFNNKGFDSLSQEALAYCFSAIVSMLDIAVIQNQHGRIFEIIQSHFLVPTIESPQVGKYGVIALQFLLHSKTEAEWNGNDAETDKALQMLLNSLIDKRQKVQKQSQKSLCILFQNSKIERLIKPLATFQSFISTVFNQQMTQKGNQLSAKTILVLNFLAAALQLMPISQCCDVDGKILRLTSVDDPSLKTHAYLTLEVLYASRRFTNCIEHVEQILRQLLENQETLSTYKSNQEQEEMRVISYMQCTTQVMINLGTSGLKGNDVLKYVSACFSVFCEYFMHTTLRIRNAAFSALRIIIQQCLKKEYFQAQSAVKSQAQDILNLDALTLDEEISNIRRGTNAGFSNADKVIIHLRYLLTSRFEDSQDLTLNLMKTFIQTVGSALNEAPELLLAVAAIRATKEGYKPWTSCIGSFMQNIGGQRFFEALPLKVLDFDMNSLSYGQNSRSYLIPLIKKYLTNGDLAFYVQYFLPMILSLDQLRQSQLGKEGSEIKAKKYETLEVQLWDILPNFCHYNSSKLSSAFASLIAYLEPMINQNALGLRHLALRVFSELINHCRTTSEVTHEIKQTRLGLQRICMDYIEGLAKLYNSQTDFSVQDKKQILMTLQDFSSIAKSVKLSNLFLQSFAGLIQSFQDKQQTTEQVMKSLDVLLAMMEKVKLKKENYISLMKGLKSFIDNSQTSKLGYKLLAKIIEKYDITEISELFSIQKELNPLLVGQASKQRLFLMKSYVFQMNKFKDDSKNAQQIGELLKVMIVELITAFTHSNQKVRKLAEEIITSIFELTMSMKVLPSLFQMLLVGFAGTKTTTQSATIRVLLLLIKINYSKKEQENSLKFEDPTFQDFLRKVTKIIILFLKDHTAGNELHRSVLKFIKTVISFLPAESLKGELTESMINGMLLLTSNKNDQLIKKILSKFIKKLGLQYVRQTTPQKHQKLIDYIEREKRKRVNKLKRKRLLALLGKEEKEQLKIQKDIEMKEGNEDDGSDDDDNYSLDSDGDESEEEEDEEEYQEKKGKDSLMGGEIDIPRVDDIPVVSKLAKEKQALHSKVEQLKDTKDKVKQAIEVDQEEFESHFVDNPFIKLREKTMQRNMVSKSHLNQTKLEAKEEEQDIIMVKETGKFVIKDLEEEEVKTKSAKQNLKRTRLEAEIGSDSDSDSDGETEDTGALKEKINALRKKQKTGISGSSKAIPVKQKNSISGGFKQKKPQVTEEEGHIVKYSGSTYKSAKGQGDTLKAGKYEPFAYIQLNPKMLNKRNKAKAVKSFEGVVSHGKKTNKRANNQKSEGMLSGLAYKKQ